MCRPVVVSMCSCGSRRAHRHINMFPGRFVFVRTEFCFCTHGILFAYVRNVVSAGTEFLLFANTCGMSFVFVATVVGTYETMNVGWEAGREVFVTLKQVQERNVLRFPYMFTRWKSGGRPGFFRQRVMQLLLYAFL